VSGVKLTYTLGGIGGVTVNVADASTAAALELTVIWLTLSPTAPVSKCITGTVIVHDPFAPNAAPLRLIVSPDACASTPPHPKLCPDCPIHSPAGSLSVKLIPLSIVGFAIGLPFTIVMLNVLFPLAEMLAGLKLVDTRGRDGAGPTVSVADAVTGVASEVTVTWLV
jgi:hypothetical protein